MFAWCRTTQPRLMKQGIIILRIPCCRSKAGAKHINGTCILRHEMHPFRTAQGSARVTNERSFGRMHEERIPQTITTRDCADKTGCQANLLACFMKSRVWAQVFYSRVSASAKFTQFRLFGLQAVQIWRARPRVDRALVEILRVLSNGLRAARSISQLALLKKVERVPPVQLNPHHELIP